VDTLLDFAIHSRQNDTQSQKSTRLKLDADTLLNFAIHRRQNDKQTQKKHSSKTMRVHSALLPAQMA
jgi:hypothetical protein